MSVKIYSETLFLLVENYNYDHFCLASAGQGIFDTSTLEEKPLFHRFGFLAERSEEETRFDLT
jgi:hypothetical protein